MAGTIYRRRAHTLVLSLTLAAFILLLALSACTLMTIHGASAAADFARARARLNLTAAARIALGEVQETLGPDRRITANAALLQNGPGSIPHPRWCGVWRTDRLKNEPRDAAPFVHRTADGALIDDRFHPASARRYDRKTETLRWLVSGRTATPDTRHADAVPLTPELSAPTETLDPQSRFAWAADDNAQKCCIRPSDTRTVVTESHPRPEGTGLALIPDYEGDGRPPSVTEIPTFDSLIASGIFPQKSAEALAPDITHDSRAVFADTLRGGLRTDLTPYLLSGNAGGISDAARLLHDGAADNPFRRHGPTFGLLRQWAALHEQTSTTGAISQDDGSRYADLATDPANLLHDGTHANLPDLAAPTRAPIAPVVAEAAVYRRLSCDFSRRGTGDAPWLRLHLHPRVVLWNPYSEKLAGARYLVHLRITGSPVFSFPRSGKKLTGAVTGWRVYTNTLVNYATTQGTLLFTLDCPDLPPGESRLFMPAVSAPLYAKSVSSKTYDPLANRLMAVSALSPANFYLEDTDAFEDAGLKNLSGANFSGESWRLENSAAEDFSVALKRLPPGTPGDWSSLRHAPTLRYVSHSVKAGAGTTPVAGWPAGRAELLAEAIDAGPPGGTRDGLRLRRFEETSGNRAAYPGFTHLDIAPLADHNPAAAASCLHPLAHATPVATTSNRRAEQFGLFTRDETDPASEWAALAPAGAVTAHPFGRPAEVPSQRAVIALTLPPAARDIRHLAELSDAPISPWAWHPAHLLGESAATPLAPPFATSHPRDTLRFADLPLAGPKLARWTRESEAPETLRTFDLRYELHHALADRFSFLTGDEAQRRAFAQNFLKHRLPDGDLAPAPDADLSQLVGPNAPAAACAVLLRDRAFNINSTSVLAWKLLLAEHRGLGPLAGEKGAEPRLTPFARDTSGNAVETNAAPTHPDFASGHRRLSDGELQSLAEAIVTEVKLRGPFLSLSDFLNRRLSATPVDLSPEHPSDNAGGPLANAILRARLNPASSGNPVPRGPALPGSRYLTAQQSPGRHDGSRAHLMSSDILRGIGPRLSARGDTLTIHLAVIDASGSTARATLTLQRTPEPLYPAPLDPLNPDTKNRPDFGRRWVVTGRRYEQEP